MAEVTASLVKELREITGAGMMECKKALVETEGDIERAIDVLRTAGLAAVAKKSGRATNEGNIAAVVSPDGATGALVELNCETDFVGINEKFKAYADRIALAVLDSKPADLEALLAAQADGETVEAVITDAIHTLGENIKLARFAYAHQDGGAVVSYIHGGGKIGVLVEFKLGDGALATDDAFKRYGRDIAMQVAASSPVAVNRDAVDPAVMDRELAIYRAQAAESGKPEAVQEKMTQGRVEKYYKESCLVEQEFVKDPDQSVSQYTAKVAKELGATIEVVAFTRFLLGE
ncbi:MAG: translation elongation factor Ts [Eggerthellaceae bacterium]|nr:translation elongation factor Ts [Eggerthellaceae bacterium]